MAQSTGLIDWNSFNHLSGKICQDFHKKKNNFCQEEKKSLYIFDIFLVFSEQELLHYLYFNIK